MTKYGTIKIPREVYEAHNKRRKQLGLTWSQYINSQEPESQEVDLTPVLNRLDDLEAELTTLREGLQR